MLKAVICLVNNCYIKLSLPQGKVAFCAHPQLYYKKKTIIVTDNLCGIKLQYLHIVSTTFLCKQEQTILFSKNSSSFIIYRCSFNEYGNLIM